MRSTSRISSRCSRRVRISPCSGAWSWGATGGTPTPGSGPCTCICFAATWCRRSCSDCDNMSAMIRVSGRPLSRSSPVARSGTATFSCSRACYRLAASRCGSTGGCGIDRSGPVVIDLIIEGISLLVTQRSEFAAVLERAGVDGLLAELNARVTQPDVSRGGPGPHCHRSALRAGARVAVVPIRPAAQLPAAGRRRCCQCAGGQAAARQPHLARITGADARPDVWRDRASGCSSDPC